MALGRTGAEIKTAFRGVQAPEYDLGDVADLTDAQTYTPVLLKFRGNIEYTNDLGVKITTSGAIDLTALTDAERDKILGLIEDSIVPPA